MHKVHWLVGLSNGENHKEGKGHFQIIPEELSPWQRLLCYCAERKLTITSISLGTDDGRRWNLPSAGKNPKFKAFADAPKPAAYNMFRKVGFDVLKNGERSGDEDRYAVIEARYEDGMALQVWVDDETLASWSMVV